MLNPKPVNCYSVAQIIGQWKIANIFSDKAFDWNGDGVQEKDIYATWTDCQRENLFVFSTDSVGNYQFDCAQKSGTWSLEGKTIIIIPSGMATLYEQIDSLRSNQIKTESVLQPRPGEYFRVYKTWERL